MLTVSQSTLGTVTVLLYIDRSSIDVMRFFSDYVPVFTEADVLFLERLT
jgi:hypothetical protein